MLLNKLSKIEGIKWIRVLYCYPEEIYDELISEMATNDKVLKYLDLPIQHISSKILKLMGRKTTKEDIINKIEKLRREIPEIALRTSLIVGFPNETEEDFNELKEFLKEYKLEKVGVFKYSREEGTPAAIMGGQIDEETKEAREKELMLLQSEISNEINSLKIGKTYDVLVEGFNGEYYYGRNYEMAPEIDGNVFFKKKHCGSYNGEIVKVKIEENTEYDLIGVGMCESCK